MKIQLHHLDSEGDFKVIRDNEDGCIVSSSEFDLALSYDGLYSLTLELARVLSEIENAEERSAMPRHAPLKLVTSN